MNKIIILLFINIVYGQHRHQRIRISLKTTTAASVNTICKTEDGYFADKEQCDAYFECKNWRPRKKFCPDGLRFKPGTPYKVYPCVYPTEHECGKGLRLQKAVPTTACPHQYGYFSAVNSSDCGKYKSCVAGKQFEFHCPEGLAYNEKNYQCEWADLVKSCDVEAFLGFYCPGLYTEESTAYTVNYKHPSDCKKYFMCIKGKPRLLSCGAKQVFDEYTGICADEDSVDCTTLIV